MDPVTIIFGIAVVIFSIILHEVMHGYAAYWLGDLTAKYAGRLTLNPIPHIDLVGSILLPALLALTHSPFLIGWAKPVPYNPYNLRNQRWGEAIVAGAGPLTNILLAILFGLTIRFFGDALSPALFSMLVIAVSANLVLAIFNLIPIPPLDGSKLLRSILPFSARAFYQRLESVTYALGPFGLLAVGLIAIYLLWPVLSGLVLFLFSLITGLS